MVICPDCGKEVKDAKFCSNCGSLLPKAEEVEDKAVDIPVEAEPIEEDAVEEEVVQEVEEESVEEPEIVEEKASEEAVDVPVEEDVAQEDDVGEKIVEEEAVDAPVEEEPAEEADEETIEVTKKSKFCPNCGKEIAGEAAFCPGCGYKIISEEKPQTKFCQNCGKKIDINAEICPHCGVRVANAPSSGEKNVLLAAILSFLFPGLGHLYLGLNKKGISFILAYIVSAILVMLIIGFVLVIIVWIWALIDSIKSTEAINRGEFVEDKLI